MSTRVTMVALLACLAAPLLAGENDCPVDTIDGRFYCEECDLFTSLDMTCKTCKTKNKLVIVCVRIGHTCEACKTWQLAKGDCPTCKKPLIEKEVITPVVYLCDACKLEYEFPGICDKCKADVRQTCRKSGTCPHTAR